MDRLRRRVRPDAETSQGPHLGPARTHPARDRLRPPRPETIDRQSGLLPHRTPAPRLIYRILTHTGRKGEPKSFTEHHFAALLDAAHQQIGAPILLVWDQLPQHKSARMRALITARRWLRVYPLPTLAPELNPTETVWSSLKRSMANLAPGTIADLARITRNRVKSMQYQPALISGFFASTGLRPP